MLDYISIELVGINPAQLLRNPLLPFCARVNLDTGEVEADKYGVITQRAKYRELFFMVKSYEGRENVRTTIKGSLHKFAKGNNYTDFTLSEIKHAIAELCELVGIAPRQCKNRGFEFGVNVITDLPPWAAVIPNILTHNDRPFELREFNGEGYLINFYYPNYYHIKVYDKSLQYGLGSNILRFEIHAEKMAYFKTKGLAIENLSDLLNTSIYCSLKDIALKTFDSLIFTDDRIQLNMLTDVERRRFNEFSNPRYWSLPTANRTQRQRAKIQFNDLRIKYAPDDMKNNLRDLIESKWESLIQSSVTISPYLTNTGLLQFHTYINEDIVTPQRSCLTCGRDISKQRPGSMYCSEALHGREVKKCRNIVSNLLQHDKRRYPGVTLFNVDEYLQPKFRRLKAIGLKTLI